MNAGFVKKELLKYSNPQKAKILRGFFKTGKGEYGEGDIFLGVAVPEQRKIAKQYSELDLGETQKLLKSEIHENRMIALLILIEKFAKAGKEERKKLYEFYLNNIKGINNWDLVDLSAPKICGAYLLENKKDRKILYKFAKSKNIWERRISIISTFALLKKGDFPDTLKISKILLSDSHDLIHKAVGWMLREIGKIDQKAEEEFLRKFYRKMPRTMLRYAIERFDDKRKSLYMAK